jgi:hypothetical protein
MIFLVAALSLLALIALMFIVSRLSLSLDESSIEEWDAFNDAMEDGK